METEMSKSGRCGSNVWNAPLAAALKLIFLFDFDISDNYSQFLLMHIDSRYPIRHRLPPGGSGERARNFINLGRGLSPLRQQEKTAHHLFARSRTLRIKPTCGFSVSV